MAKQALLWTALPNGYAENDRSRGRSLRVSLLLSPRLTAGPDQQQLSSFPDFVDWPATLANTKFVVRFGSDSVTIASHDSNKPNRIDPRLGLPRSSVWKALFPDPAAVVVENYTFRDLSNNRVLSYPAASMDKLVRDLYRRLAASAGDNLPTASAILQDAAWADFVGAVQNYDKHEKYFDRRLGVRVPRQMFTDFVNDEFKFPSTKTREVALFQLFHTPPSRATLGKYSGPPDEAKERARWLAYERTTLPDQNAFQSDIDFHRIVSAMNQYPTLLRLLGLVVDVLIAPDAFSPAAHAPLRVEVTLPPGAPGVTRAPDTSPRTTTLLDDQRFQAVPRSGPKPGDYRTADGLLDLDPQTFSLLQADVDGGGLKVTNFARTLVRVKDEPVKRLDPVTRREREVGAPALRNAGLMLVHTGRGSMLKNSFDRQKKFNTAAEKIQSGQAQTPPTLLAEDLVRGWRVDIWDDKTKDWHSLCRRVADYDLNDGEVQISVPEEEGCVRLAATKSPDGVTNRDIVWLHEALVSWTGWSLCAPPPGKTIHHEGSDHTDPVGEPEAEVPPGLRLRSTFRAVPGSLPRLRYGRRYWLRARTVDLAGNSLAATEKDFGPEQPAQNARPYLRYEPISAPSLALVKPTALTVEPPFEGESMDRLAVRTFNEQPSDNNVPSTQKARRFAVPPRTSHREAEQHGMLDRNGVVDPTFYATLAAQDNSLDEEQILSAGPLNGGDPVETGYAVMREREALPYLPEPLAVEVAARIFDYPGFSSHNIITIPLYAADTEWPQARPFKIELYEEPGKKPHYDETMHVLRVPLPKAVRVTLRLSMKPTKRALELLGVWDLLTNAQKSSLRQRALDGQHWMLTPWRNVELVHAVQKPLITPEIVKHNIDRGLRATFVNPTFTATCSIKSTDHLDVLARWNEPVEDVKQPTGGNRERDDHAFAAKITEAKGYAGTPEYDLQGTDLVRVGSPGTHDVVRKVHEFNDTRYRRIEYWFEATTAFREYMPTGVLTEGPPDDLKPTDEHIKVTGPKLRTWIPSSAPPPAPEVLYVVPTFGWVRSHEPGETKSTWRRGGGLRVYLNRPWNVSGYGEMLAVVVPPASFQDDPNDLPTGQPYKNFVTQWGNDPVWLSPFVAGAAPKRSNFPLARTAADPSGEWLPDFAPATEADQPPGPFKDTGLWHPELSSQAGVVEVAPHDVFYDEERQLWYCDIEVDFGSAYYPFIRLALARYQPVSVPGAHLSNIVLADFMALVPDRWLTVTRTNAGQSRQVSVFGHTYKDSSSHTEAALILDSQGAVILGAQPLQVSPTSVIEVWVERFYPALGEDFGWRRESAAVVQQGSAAPVKKRQTVAASRRARATRLLERRDFGGMVSSLLVGDLLTIKPMWEGTVTLPLTTAEGFGFRYRLAIAEYEEYLVDDVTPYEMPLTGKGRRLVFIEYVELD